MKNNPLHKVDVLLVEDDHSDALFTKISLVEEIPNLIIAWAEDGDEAIRYLNAEAEYQTRDKTQLPKLIILDMNLPKQDGIEILSKLKSSDFLKKIPVIMFSAIMNKNLMKKSIELGAEDFIVKSLDFSSFTNELIEKGGKYIK